MSMDKIRRECDEAGGLARVTLGDLRDAEGKGRLGKHVIQHIRRKLDGIGLGYFPPAVLEDNHEPRQTDEVRVYLKDSEVGRIVDAVLRPGESGDELLRGLSTQEAVYQLEQVREIVCDHT